MAAGADGDDKPGFSGVADTAEIVAESVESIRIPEVSAPDRTDKPSTNAESSETAGQQEKFEQLKIGEVQPEQAGEYDRDAWVLAAEPVIYLNASQGTNRWIQIGYGLSLERFYQRFYYRLGLRQFRRIFSRDSEQCSFVLVPASDEPVCLSRTPESSIGFFTELGARHTFRKFFLSYAGGLEINRYQLSFESDSEVAIRFSTRAGYRIRNYGISASMFASLSARKFLWGAGFDLFLLY